LKTDFSLRESGWPLEFEKESPKMYPSPFFYQN
jgi:hypothetical protein